MSIPIEEDRLLPFENTQPFVATPSFDNETPTSKAQAATPGVLTCVKNLGLSSIPNTLHLLLMIIVNTISLHFISLSGDQILITGLGLGLTFIYTSCVFVMETMNMGTIVYCATAYGAEQPKLVGLYFHKSMILRVLLLIPSLLLVFLSYYIFMLIGVNQQVAEVAYTFMLNCIPWLMCLAIFNVSKYFIISHNVFVPVLILQAIVTFGHVGFCELLVVHYNFGVQGVAYSMAISHFIGAILILSYLYLSKEFKETFFIFEKESFRDLWGQFKNEFFIAAPYFLEWVALELYTFIAAAYFVTDELNAWVVMYNLINVAYMFPFGLGICTSTEIGNAFGEKNAQKAKNYIKASLIMTLGLVVFVIVGIELLRNYLSVIYGGTNNVNSILDSLLLLYFCFLPADYFQVCTMTLLKSAGKEVTATKIFMFSYYLVGLSTGFFVGVVQNLECKGSIIGLGTGQYVLLALSSIVLYFTDIPTQIEVVQERMMEFMNSIVSSEKNGPSEVTTCGKSSEENSRLLMKPSDESTKSMSI
mmetsp:Transcript_49359/g.56856  ORF Transcript_49359/g.56856 Transcript_49359/m.56856 type:complete len:531 (-) Transcript_49359:92-1684(-)